MDKFGKLLKKLQPIQDPKDYVTAPVGISREIASINPLPVEYVTDRYSNEDMNRDIANSTKQLTQDDLENIHFIESTQGKYLKSSEPGSTARGNYHMNDGHREAIAKIVKNEGIDVNDANPLRYDANLMKVGLPNQERILKEAYGGPFDPNLRNMYAMHKFGNTGGLRMINNEKGELSKKRWAEIDDLLARRAKDPIMKLKTPRAGTQEAKDLLELLGE